MAAFARPDDALAAALAVQRELAAFNAAEARPLTIKLGLHEGPCIAVTLNGRLDYIGHPVNMAARPHDQSDSGGLALSQAIAEGAGVRRRVGGGEGGARG